MPDGLKLAADLIGAGDKSRPTINTAGWASWRMRSHSGGVSRQFSGNRTTPAFAAAKYSNGYHGAFLASTATLVPLPHPTPTRRFARRLAAAAASAKVSERPPPKTNSAPGRSRAQ